MLTEHLILLVYVHVHSRIIISEMFYVCVHINLLTHNITLLGISGRYNQRNVTLGMLY